jgi:NAD(P)-dependent dehydrogenase (short-subunit alcohol dehydrogenase family)
MPDNQALLGTADLGSSVKHRLTSPMLQAISLAKLLNEHGAPGAPLILLGSTFSQPGRHRFRSPLYSTAKSALPTLIQALALELAHDGKRCIGIEFDMIDGGMNAGMNEINRRINADRTPLGRLPTAGEAADQIVWLLSNSSWLVSGTTLRLTGGSIP